MRHRILSILTVFLLISMVFSVITFNVSANDCNDDLGTNNDEPIQVNHIEEW